jgi:hypothetical protein
VNVNIRLIDICFCDYLLDHHNRDGEILVGVPLRGQSAEEMASDIVDEVNRADDGVPETLTDDLVYEHALACLALPRMSFLSPIPEFAPNPCECGQRNGDCDCEQPSAWFLVKWDIEQQEVAS